MPDGLYCRDRRHLGNPLASREVFASTRTASSAEQSEPGERYAVVVGINDYRHDGIRNLQFARKDAESIYRTLTDPQTGSFKPENVVLLLDEGAGQRDILSAIGTNLPKRAGSRDLACIYYAGHGAIEPDPTADDGQQKYLVPHDADPDDLYSTGIPLAKVEEFFRRLTAAQVVCFFDCCYAGGADGRSIRIPNLSLRADLTDAFLDRLGTSSPGRFVVTSCRAREVSIESAELEGGHGVFTYHLLQGLSGKADRDNDGLVTMEELFSYLAERVPETARRLRGRMTPIKAGVAEGAIYLSRYETSQQRVARSLSASAAIAFSKGDIAAAERAWVDAIAAVPGYQDALQGLAVVAARRDALAREEADRERIALEVRAARLKRLQALTESGDLRGEQLLRLTRLLEADPATLTSVEAERRVMAELLGDGRLSARQLPAIIGELESTVRVPDERPAPPQIVEVPDEGRTASQTELTVDKTGADIRPPWLTGSSLARWLLNLGERIPPLPRRLIRVLVFAVLTAITIEVISGMLQ